MNDDQMRVLEMVAAGTITPEQGENLLDVLQEDHPSKTAPAMQVRSPESRESAKRSRGRRTIETLTAARAHGISGKFVQGMHEAGVDHLDLDGLIQLSAHGISPQFVREMADLGFSHLSVDDLVRLGTHGVDPEFVRAMADMGFTNLSIDDLIMLSSHGVQPDFIREMHELGFVDLVSGLSTGTDDRKEEPGIIDHAPLDGGEDYAHHEPV